MIATIGMRFVVTFIACFLFDGYMCSLVRLGSLAPADAADDEPAHATLLEEP